MSSLTSDPVRSDKRKRTDSNDGERAETAVERSSVWFEDGNVILQAKGIQFRVHRSILATNSPIFRDMFQVGSPDVDPTCDGLPVVELPDDPVDLRRALDALYNRWYVIGFAVAYGREALSAVQVLQPVRLPRDRCHSLSSANRHEIRDQAPATGCYPISGQRFPTDPTVVGLDTQPRVCSWSVLRSFKRRVVRMLRHCTRVLSRFPPSRSISPHMHEVHR